MDTSRVSHGLNLVLKLRDGRAAMKPLLDRIREVQSTIDAGFDELSMVHFARFLPSPDGSALQVVTEFDGPLASYVLDFAVEIGDVFDMLLRATEGAEHIVPVREHPAEFLAFVEKNNLKKSLEPPREWDLYAAYPDRTVIDIVGARTALPRAYEDRRATPVELSDVQGNILRGYRAERVRHLLLRVTDPAAARAWLVERATPVDGAPLPAITSDETWAPGAEPDLMLNVGLTAPGMAALQIREAWRAAFPAAFLEGAFARAEANFDVEANGPEHWWLGGPSEKDTAHVMVSLYERQRTTAAPSRFEATAEALATSLAASGFDTLHAQDGELRGGKGWLGYMDGFAHPRVAGMDAPERKDLQPASTAGEFVLGSAYRNIYGGSSLGRLPADLAANGSFCAVRVLAQDVETFQAALNSEAARLDVQPDWLAAKLMGRWYGGAPLSLHPDKSPTDPNEHKRNDFDYAPSREFPDTLMDHAGLRCPVGAHVRRGNPRTSRVTGARYTRRLMRRGMNYTRTVKDPAGGAGKTEHGLFGLFMCADLERQFEFIQRQWLNGDRFAPGLRGTRDPFGGTAPEGVHHFEIPIQGKPALRVSLPQFVHTRGSLYLFMPGLAALRALDRLAKSDPPATATVSTRPVGAGAPTAEPLRVPFDSTAFQKDPYPVFARFREREPVHFAGAPFNGWFVFGYDNVVRVCDESENFGGTWPRPAAGQVGLFTLDEPQHGQVLNVLAAAWHKASTGVARSITASIAATLDALRDKPEFDLVDDFARRLPRDVYFDILGGAGLDAKAREDVDGEARLLMKARDATAGLEQKMEAAKAAKALDARLEGWLLTAHDERAFDGSLLSFLSRDIADGKLDVTTTVKTLKSLTVAGYMSVEFLLAMGVRRLLLDDRRWWTSVASGETPLPAFIEELRRCDHALAVVERVALQDVELGGVRIPAGTPVFGVLASANRDETVFTHGDVFDPGRASPRRHLGLGHGVHECLGRVLEKLITEPAFRELMAALPGLRLKPGVEPAWFTDFYFRSFDHLPVTTAE